MGKLSTKGEPAKSWLSGPVDADKPPKDVGSPVPSCIHYTNRGAGVSLEAISHRRRYGLASVERGKIAAGFGSLDP
jgi:hypothetical protein